jgi:hypothetical protein
MKDPNLTSRDENYSIRDENTIGRINTRTKDRSVNLDIPIQAI